MKFWFFAALLVAQQSNALTINAINVSTVDGYPDYYTPTTYPTDNRFSILGAALSYVLSDGEVRPFGAGWIPYTNGLLSGTQISGNQIEYDFGAVNNWAKGAGTVFYSLGQVWCPSCNETGAGLWTEGQLTEVSPIVLDATLGSTTATLSGVARIAFNNASNNWSGVPSNFVPYYLPEGSLVSYTAAYSLLGGATWEPDTFSKPFTYQMTGVISLVPEPATNALLLAGLGLTLVTTRRSLRRL